MSFVISGYRLTGNSSLSELVEFVAQFTSFVMKVQNVMRK